MVHAVTQPMYDSNTHRVSFLASLSDLSREESHCTDDFAARSLLRQCCALARQNSPPQESHRRSFQLHVEICISKGVG